KFKKSEFVIPVTSLPQVSQLHESIADEQKQMQPELEAFESPAGRRLLTALDLWGASPTAAKMGNSPQQQAECMQLLGALAVLEEQVGRLNTLRNSLATMAALFNQLSSNQENQALGQEIQSLMGAMAMQVRGLRDSMAAVPYPFDHAQKGISMAEYALAALPDPEDPAALYGAADSLLHPFF